ncbi:(2Fe-2S)-binding protein [Labrys neptuniae]
MAIAAQFHRIARPDRREITCFIDGAPVAAFEGDTVLTAVLTQRRDLRRFEFSSATRSGFCLMGACQDCWVWTAEGARLRACSTLAADGLRIVTGLKAQDDGGQADV